MRLRLPFPKITARAVDLIMQPDSGEPFISREIKPAFHQHDALFVKLRHR